MKHLLKLTSIIILFLNVLFFNTIVAKNNKNDNLLNKNVTIAKNILKSNIKEKVIVKKNQINSLVKKEKIAKNNKKDPIISNKLSNNKIKLDNNINKNKKNQKILANLELEKNKQNNKKLKNQIIKNDKNTIASSKTKNFNNNKSKNSNIIANNDIQTNDIFTDLEVQEQKTQEKIAKAPQAISNVLLSAKDARNLKKQEINSDNLVAAGDENLDKIFASSTEEDNVNDLNNIKKTSNINVYNKINSKLKFKFK